MADALNGRGRTTLRRPGPATHRTPPLKVKDRTPPPLPGRGSPKRTRAPGAAKTSPLSPRGVANGGPSSCETPGAGAATSESVTTSTTREHKQCSHRHGTDFYATWAACVKSTLRKSIRPRTTRRLAVAPTWAGARPVTRGAAPPGTDSPMPLVAAQLGAKATKAREIRSHARSPDHALDYPLQCQSFWASDQRLSAGGTV